MVEAAADVDADAVDQGLARGQDGASGGEIEGLDHLARIGHFELDQVVVAETAVFKLVDPLGGVDEQDVGTCGQRRLKEVVGAGEEFVDQELADEAVLDGREDMIAELQVVAFVIDQRERQHGQAPAWSAVRMPRR